jgi:hypothetical protein
MGEEGAGFWVLSWKAKRWEGTEEVGMGNEECGMGNGGFGMGNGKWGVWNEECEMGLGDCHMLNEELEMGNDSARRNVVQEKSFAFAVGIVKAGRRLRLDRKEWVLSKQLIRAGTSIGANIEEAIAAQSKKDFQNSTFHTPHSTLRP